MSAVLAVLILSTATGLLAVLILTDSFGAGRHTDEPTGTEVGAKSAARWAVSITAGAIALSLSGWRVPAILIGVAAGSLTIVVRTVGAALRWVTPSASISRQISSPRTARRHTWRPVIAVTAQVVHQPLQWNIGRVHR